MLDHLLRRVICPAAIPAKSHLTPQPTSTRSGTIRPVPTIAQSLQEAVRPIRIQIGWCRRIPEFSRQGEPNIVSRFYVRFTPAAKLRYQPTPANQGAGTSFGFLPAWAKRSRARGRTGSTSAQQPNRGLVVGSILPLELTRGVVEKMPGCQKLIKSIHFHHPSPLGSAGTSG